VPSCAKDLSATIPQCKSNRLSGNSALSATD
jgi:hypothetical protein